MTRLARMTWNDYVDYLLGQGLAFLGHFPPSVLAAVEKVPYRDGQRGRESLRGGGRRAPDGILRWPEMVRFGSSGTEMVQDLRLARAATGRTRVVRFGGHCHGWLDNILVSIDGRVASAGQPAEALASTTVLPPFPS